MLQGSKLFYIYKEDPLPDGVLETEELIEEDNDDDE